VWRGGSGYVCRVGAVAVVRAGDQCGIKRFGVRGRARDCSNEVYNVKGASQIHLILPLFLSL
jgi:hypothetical protein